MAPKTVVVGGGIGGCAAAIALHRAGADVTVYEAAPELKELGAGINIQAVAVGVLLDLGIPLEKFHGEEGDCILTGAVEYLTPEGFFIASEAVGLKAGAPHPQLSAHRAKFHNVLVTECRRLLGEERLVLSSRFLQLERAEDGQVVLHFENSTTKEKLPPVRCDFVVGADGLKSRVRGQLLGDGAPR
ncbi:unnamed protein product, partial [Effrenium voratum]